MKTIRIGNGCGFWGDSLDAPVNLARHGNLDYLTLEYLAELTMSILALQKQRDPMLGYATDFISVLERLSPILAEQPQLKIVTNAGGMNAASCAQAALNVLKKQNITNRKIGIVLGDDLLPKLDELLQAGNSLAHLDSGKPLAEVRDRVVSANAYLGAQPIAEAIAQGANIVITGRIADASLTVGPCLHEFGWEWNDWRKLNAATVAGHLIECGAQATGGLWMNADASTNLANVGYPIAIVQADGTHRITKPSDSGGAVNIETISEQLLYEVADPANYFTPDVVADFTNVQLQQIERDVVEVRSGAGQPATDTYKVSIAYRDGFTAAGTLLIPGPNAVAKAHASATIIRERLRIAGIVLEHFSVETLGAGDCVPGVMPRSEPPEVVLRIAVRDARKRNVQRFAKEFAPLATSGYAGTTGYTTGRAQVREVFAYWPALIAKSAVQSKVDVME